MSKDLTKRSFNEILFPIDLMHTDPVSRQSCNMHKDSTTSSVNYCFKAIFTCAFGARKLQHICIYIYIYTERESEGGR